MLPGPSLGIFSLLWGKVKRWLPVYWAFIVIYWCISPTLHAGPVWYEYQADATICNSAWWRVLLFIDNWFDKGCYNFAWFIPAEIQLSLICVLFLLLYSIHKKLSFVILALSTISSWILTLTLSAPFPSSLDTTLSSNS